MMVDCISPPNIVHRLYAILEHPPACSRWLSSGQAHAPRHHQLPYHRLLTAILAGQLSPAGVAEVLPVILRQGAPNETAVETMIMYAAPRGGGRLRLHKFLAVFSDVQV